MAKRDKQGKFLKGASSPNPKGRPAGVSVATQIRQSITDKAPEIVDMLIAKALEEQDVQSGLALLNKIAPNLKSSSEPVAFKLDTKKGLTATGEQIVQNIADGTIALDSGAAILSSLANLAKMQEVDNLSKRIEKLENAK